MPTPMNIGSDYEKPARPGRYQVLIGINGEVKLWWTDGELARVQLNIGLD